MHNYDVKLTVVSSQCPKYKAGDVICFEGAFINKEKSAALCMVALNAVYPFVYAIRRGSRRSASSPRAERQRTGMSFPEYVPGSGPDGS